MKKLAYLLLGIVLLEGPYHVFLAKRSFQASTGPVSVTGSYELSMLWVAPFFNPQEQYRYFDFPFCRYTFNHSHDSAPSPSTLSTGVPRTFPLFQILAEDSGVVVRAAMDGSVPAEQDQSCTTAPLTKEQAERLDHAIRYGNSFYEGNIAGLPVWANVGAFDAQNTTSATVIYTRHSLTLGMNELGEIVSAALMTELDSCEKIEVGKAYTFRMRAQYRSTEGVSWQDRWKIYDYPSNSRWFNHVLSTMLVLALYSVNKSMTSDNPNQLKGASQERSSMTDRLLPPTFSEEIRRAVYQEPPHLSLLAALVGTGIQLIPVVWLLAWFLAFRPMAPFLLEPVCIAFLTTLMSRIAFSSLFGGFASTKMVLTYASPDAIQESVIDVFQDELKLEANYLSDDNASNDGIDDDLNDDKIYLERCVRATMILTTTLFGGFHCCLLLLLHVLSLMKGTIWMRLDTNQIISVLGIWVLMTLCCLFGVHLARRFTIRVPGKSKEFPTKRYSLHDQSAKISNLFGCFKAAALAAAINFLSLVSECNVLFAPIWNYRLYAPSAFILVSCGISMTTIVLSTRICLYDCLVKRKQNGSNWQWMAFGCGAMTSFYVVIYGLFYAKAWTDIVGWYEYLISFVLIFCISIDIGLFYGGISYLTGHYFVRSMFPRMAD